MTWKPIDTAPIYGGGRTPPFRFGPWVLIRNADQQAQARWCGRLTGTDNACESDAFADYWEDRDGVRIMFDPREWQEMRDQEIAHITEVLALIAGIIDEPPSTSAEAFLVGQKLEQGLLKVGRSGVAGRLIGKDPSGFHGIVALRALGRRLFILGRTATPGAGIRLMTDSLSAAVRDRWDSKLKSLGVIGAAWSGIGQDGGHDEASA